MNEPIFKGPKLIGDKKEVAKAGIIITQKIFDDTGWFRNLLIMSGFHDEAAKVTKAMKLLESVGSDLQKLAVSPLD